MFKIQTESPLNPEQTVAPKRELILATAEGLIRQYGIKRTRVEEICRRAGIGKATFYKYFANRNAIALEVLDRLTARLRAEYEQELFGPQPFAQRMQRLLSLKREGIEALGPALIADLVDAPPDEILTWLKNEQTRSYDTALRFFRAGQAAGAINPGFEPDYLIYLLDVVQTMFNDPRFKELYPDLLSRSSLLNQFLLFGLSANPDSKHVSEHVSTAEAQHGI